MRKLDALSALDSKALVARLALVKERVLEDAAAANPYGPHDPSELNTAKTKAQVDAERKDTEAVLDECAVRLLGHQAPSTPSEVERLRAMIRTLVRAQSRLTPEKGCPACGSRGVHDADCPWLPLSAEAAKPRR